MTVTMVSSATVDVDRLARRYSALSMRLAGLQGQARELQSKQTRLTRDIGLAKARLELGPQVLEACNYLQERAHARAVGDFEDLLSAFVADVVPEAGKIHLALGTERGAPALDIMLDNGGDLENILEGNGGGVTNVVVTGLGFSALARTSNRQLMVLDEPDCWLKAKYVPNFTKVIAEVANPRVQPDGSVAPGCQTLMISHNDITLMDDGAHIQDLRTEYNLDEYAARLGVSVAYVGDVTECAHVVYVPGTRGKGRIEVRYRPAGEGDEEQNALTKGFPFLESISGARAWEADHDGVRWIEVENLRRHVLTRMPLSSGLNVLTGDINGGKSTLYFTALRAMAYGESDDTMIRHGADTCAIRVGLENDVVLEMIRSRKGSPKVLFRRYEKGVMVNEGRQETRGGVPSFILDVLKIDRVDELDIQLRSQKQPVFLLNETASRRAKLLSVGRESGLLSALIEKHRKQTRSDKEQVKLQEIELNQINRTLTVMAPLVHVAAVAEILDSMLDDVRAAQSQLHAVQAVVAKLTPLVGKAKLHSLFGAELDKLIAMPVVTDTKPLAEVVRRLARNKDAAMLPDLGAVPKAPVLADCKGMEVLVQRLARTHGAARLPAMPAAPAVPKLSAVSDLSNTIDTLARNVNASAMLTRLPLLPGLPSVTDTGELRKNGVKLSRLIADSSALEKDYNAVGIEVQDANTALESLKKSMGVCPVCNQAFGEHNHA